MRGSRPVAWTGSARRSTRSRPASCDEAVRGPSVLDGEQHRARLALREADGRAGGRRARTIRSGLQELRAVGLPLWIARGLRVLEEAGEATGGEIGERASVEAALGVVRPTL